MDWRENKGGIYLFLFSSLEQKKKGPALQCALRPPTVVRMDDGKILCSPSFSSFFRTAFIIARRPWP
jgi:hypothetical protein